MIRFLNVIKVVMGKAKKKNQPTTVDEGRIGVKKLTRNFLMVSEDFDAFNAKKISFVHQIFGFNESCHIFLRVWLNFKQIQ